MSRERDGTHAVSADRFVGFQTDLELIGNPQNGMVSADRFVGFQTDCARFWSSTVAGSVSADRFVGFQTDRDPPAFEGSQEQVSADRFVGFQTDVAMAVAVIASVGVGRSFCRLSNRRQPVLPEAFARVCRQIVLSAFKPTKTTM